MQSTVRRKCCAGSGRWQVENVQVLCKHRSKNAEQRVQWHSAATIQGERKAALQLRVEACAMTRTRTNCSGHRAVARCNARSRLPVVLEEEDLEEGNIQQLKTNMKLKAKEK